MTSTITVTKPKFNSNTGFGQSFIKDNGSNFRRSFTGTLIMEPKVNEHEEYGQSINIGIEFEEKDVAILDTLIEHLKDASDFSNPDIKPAHKDGLIFFKLPTDSNHQKFQFECNVPIKPLKLMNDKIYKGMDVTVDMCINGWFLDKEETFKLGLVYKIKKLIFGEEKNKKKKVRALAKHVHI